MPGKVQDLLMARLDRLNAAKVVAQYASSIGRHFSQSLIQAVCTHESAPIRVDGVLFHLESLVRAGILGQSNLGQGVQYHFRHALMQDAAYESLWERDRRRCHATVARVISESFPGLAAGQPEVLARHCGAAGLPEPAVQYYENAARLAISRAAQEEASQHLSAALALIESLPSGSARDRTELRLLLLQAGQGIALHGYGADQVGTSYRRAEALSRQCGDKRALLRVQFGLEGYLFMRGEFQRAHEVAAGAAELLQSVADPMRRVQAQWAVANLVFHEGHLAEAVRRMDACLADYGKLEQRTGQMQDPAVMSLSYSALAQWALGFADDALARAEQALALATRLKHPLSLGEAHGLKAMLHCYRRDYLDTLECAQRAIHVCESSGFAVWLAHARIMHGWAVAHLGNPKAGLAEMAAGYAQWTSTGAVVTCAFYLGVQAEALALAGEPAQGLALLDQALAIATRCGERYFEAELCRLQGELLLHSKNNSKEANQDKAQDWFLRSIAVARELGQSAFEARAAQSLAQLRLAQGHSTEAAVLLTGTNEVPAITEQP
jgi:predicted ATPase